MKVLVFDDTHGTTDFSHLYAQAREADLILCLGDVTNFMFDFQEIFAALNEFGKYVGKPVYFVHGNHEDNAGELLAGYEFIIWLHMGVHVTPQIAVLGYGGGGFAREDARVEQFLRATSMHPDVAGKKLVFAFHGPPFGVGLDVVPGFGSTGCMSKRRMIEVLQPELVVVGHIHETQGQEVILGNTRIVNPGPQGMLIEL